MFNCSYPSSLLQNSSVDNKMISEDLNIPVLALKASAQKDEMMEIEEKRKDDGKNCGTHKADLTISNS